jgi:hypothetical protein
LLVMQVETWSYRPSGEMEGEGQRGHRWWR